MRDVGLGDKVYSPDLQTFELEGPTGVFGTLASVVVGPVRLLLRVLHNIVILPADLMKSYAEGLLLVSILIACIGVFDFLVFGKWPLLLSQIPAILLAIKLKATAGTAAARAQQKVEVDIDEQQVEELCNSIYAKLDDIVGEDGKDG